MLKLGQDSVTLPSGLGFREVGFIDVDLSRGYYTVTRMDRDNGTCPMLEYTSNGHLMGVAYSIDKDPVILYHYAYDTQCGPEMKHCPLTLITVFLPGKEELIFEPTGKITAHWIDGKCTDVEGFSCATNQPPIAQTYTRITGREVQNEVPAK